MAVKPRIVNAPPGETKKANICAAREDATTLLDKNLRRNKGPEYEALLTGLDRVLVWLVIPTDHNLRSVQKPLLNGEIWLCRRPSARTRSLAGLHSQRRR